MPRPDALQRDGCNLFATQMNIAVDRPTAVHAAVVVGTVQRPELPPVIYAYKDAADFQRPRAVDQFQQFARDTSPPHDRLIRSTTAISWEINRYAMPKSRWRSSNKLIICPRINIQRRNGFVGNDHFWIQCQRASNADALALTAGKLMWVTPGMFR